MKVTGLSLDQAPPVDLPYRFFLTAPLFAAGAGLLLMWQGETVFASRWTPPALAVSHLLVIGFLGQVMCGALLQMLPVIAGSPFPAVRHVGTVSHLLLSAGVVLMSGGFIAGGSSTLLIGAGSAAAGFALFLVPLTMALGRARGVRDTVGAMRLSAVALAVTLLLGMLLTTALMGWIRLESMVSWVNVHLAWGLLGWAGLLIIGTAYRVVPMFHVTSAYPYWLVRGLAPSIAASLTAGSLLLWVGRETLANLVFGVAVVGFVLFALVTVWLQVHRRRPRLDATMLHWWAAMASLVAAASIWLVRGPPEIVGMLLLVGVGVGLPSGMLLKIVPFLSWFHLQHLQLSSGRLDLSVPHMNSYIPDRYAGIHFALHLTAVLLLVVGFAVPVLIPVGGLALAGSSLLLGGLVLRSAWRFRGLARALRVETS